jgi:hypothetical protein
MNFRPVIAIIPVFFLAILLGMNRCVTEFVPEIKEEQELLVVEGLITDQPETYSIKISRSLPVGLKSEARPVSGCVVTVIDNTDTRIRFVESEAGTYNSPPGFTGQIGKTYKLYISTPSGSGILNYESEPVVMLPVAPISDLYYEKILVRDEELHVFDVEACQVYLNSVDVGYGSDYLRWEYLETWVLRLPFSVPNQKCWISERSKHIQIKSTAAFKDATIKRQPIIYISEATDRLRTRYSIEVSQYSLNEDEYNFWEALKNLVDESGGLYDIIPASIPSNIKCINKADQTVLGYFSVSAKSSRRIYIDEDFAGIFDPYKNCITDTVYGDDPIPRLDTAVWVLFDKPMAFPNPRTRILTRTYGCYDCTVRGTTTKPSFWVDE